MFYEFDHYLNEKKTHEQKEACRREIEMCFKSFLARCMIGKCPSTLNMAIKNPQYDQRTRHTDNNNDTSLNLSSSPSNHQNSYHTGAQSPYLTTRGRLFRGYRNKETSADSVRVRGASASRCANTSSIANNSMIMTTTGDEPDDCDGFGYASVVCKSCKIIACDSCHRMVHDERSNLK